MNRPETKELVENLLDGVPLEQLEDIYALITCYFGYCAGELTREKASEILSKKLFVLQKETIEAS